MKSKTVTIWNIVAVFLMVLVLLIAIAPMLFGLYSRLIIESHIDSINSQHPFLIEIPSFDQGWFSSTFVVSVKIDKDETIYLRNEMIHGPVYLGIPKSHGSFFINAFIKSSLKLQSKNATLSREFMHVNSMFDFDGGLSGRLLGRRINIRGPESQVSDQIDFGGGEYAFQKQNNRLRVEYTIPKLGGQKLGLLIQMLNIRADVVFSGNDGVTGQVELGIAKGRFAHRAKTVTDLILSNFRLSTNIVKTSGGNDHSFMNFRLYGGVEELVWSEKQYLDMEMDFVVRNINANIQGQLKKLFKDLVQVSKPIDKKVILSNVLPLIPELLEELEIELSKFYVNTSNGFIDTWFRVSAPGLGNGSMMDPIFLLSSVQLEGEVSVAESIVRNIYTSQAMNMFTRSNDMEDISESDPDEVRQQAEKKAMAMLESLRNQRYIDLTGEQYISSINIKNGEIRINDQLFNPMQWVFPEEEAIDYVP